MTATSRLVIALLLLIVLVPLVAGWVNELLVPFVVLVVTGVVARLVWFHTRL